MDESRHTPKNAKRARAGEVAPEHVSPRRSAEQRTPKQERPTTPDEDAGQAIQQLEDPPQAEGSRERGGEERGS